MRDPAPTHTDVAAVAFPTMRRLRGAGRKLMTILAVSASAAFADNLSARDAEIRAAADEAQARFRQNDRVGCIAAVDRVAEQAMQVWSSATLPWLKARIACAPESLYAQGVEAPIEKITRTFAPWIAMLDAAPQPTPEIAALAMQMRQAMWGVMAYHHVTDRAVPLEQAYVMPLVARLRDQPSDALAGAALREWVRAQYGNPARHVLTQEWLKLLERELGEGHPLHLRLLVASAFSHRINGRPAEALHDAERLNALVQRHHSADDNLRMSAASEYGLALASADRLAEAMDQLLVWQSIEARQVPPRWDSQMRLHYNLASLALTIGDDDAAVRHGDESVRMARLTGSERQALESLAGELAKGQAKLRRGDTDAASYMRDVLQRVANSGYGVGGAAYALSRHAERVGDHELQAWAHNIVERYARERWDPLHAERPMLPLVASRQQPTGSDARQRLLEQAAVLGLAGRSGSLGAQAWFGLADERSAVQADQAIWLYKRGANVLQRLRQGLAGDDPGAQRLWLADHEPPLRRLVGLLIDRGRLLEAQQVLRVLRDEELHEYQRRSRGIQRTARAAPVMLSAAELGLENELRPFADAVRAEVPAADARADAELSFRRRTQREDHQVQQVLSQASEGLRRILSAPAALARAPDLPALDEGAPVAPGQARLLYFVRADSLDIAVQRGRRWYRVSVPLSATELARHVHALRTALLQPDRDVLPASRQLHRWLLQPVQQHLRGVKDLRLVPDGVLRFVSFAALHDGQRHAGERWVFRVEAPRADMSEREADQPRHVARVLALGRSRGDAEHAPLPAVAPELAMLSRAGVGVRVAIDEGFSAHSLSEGLAAKPSVVHLASHFVLDSTHEEGAYLLLGDGGRLPLSSLRGMHWQGVHLAVLSACDTGLPEAGVTDGRQASGLAAALHDAGASNVLATLWPVNDGATALWMQQFYRPWLTRPDARRVPDADWVARVQRDWLRRHAGTPLAHPHYWAGFVWLSRG